MKVCLLQLFSGSALCPTRQPLVFEKPTNYLSDGFPVNGPLSPLHAFRLVNQQRPRRTRMPRCTSLNWGSVPSAAAVVWGWRITKVGRHRGTGVPRHKQRTRKQHPKNETVLKYDIPRPQNRDMGILTPKKITAVFT